MWGRFHCADDDLLGFRFIPTRVGQICTVSMPLCLAFGSSPRVWGRWKSERKGNRCSRFIPTRVGQMMSMKTGEFLKRFIPTRVGQMYRYALFPENPAVHPHACGADAMRWMYIRLKRGSSPRVWGRSSRFTSCLLLHRFIPTRVGQIPFGDIDIILHSVHPHACGADLQKMAFANRGRRFIPTRVGQIMPAIMARIHSAVHPHACGAD